MCYDKDLTTLYLQIGIKNRKIEKKKFPSWMIKNVTNHFNNFGKDKFS